MDSRPEPNHCPHRRATPWPVGKMGDTLWRENISALPPPGKQQQSGLRGAELSRTKDCEKELITNY